jgi:beta-fructofuranosidase
MLSVPWTMRVVDDRVLLAPHPDVATLRTGVAARLDGAGTTEPLPPFLDVEMDAAARGRLELHLDDGPVLAVEVRDGAAEFSVPGRDAVRMAVAPEGPAVRLLLDAGLVEAATSAGEYAALRLRGDGPVRLVVPPGSGEVRVTAHAMPLGEERPFPPRTARGPEGWPFQ